MDQRWLTHLICECANQPLQVEVTEVRINPPDVKITTNGGGGMAIGGGGGKAMGGGVHINLSLRTEMDPDAAVEAGVAASGAPPARSKVIRRARLARFPRNPTWPRWWFKASFIFSRIRLLWRRRPTNGRAVMTNDSGKNALGQ